VGIAYILEMRVEKGWLKLIRRFEEILRERIGDRFIRLVARPSPDDLVYESNVAVVVRKADLNTMREVSRAALDAMEEVGMEGLSPITISEGDPIEISFMGRYEKRIARKDEWIKLIRRFEEILRERIGDRFIRLVARPSPDDLVYESNVAVVVRKADLNTMREVSRAALDAMEEVGMEGLSPITISEGDPMEHEFG
jgi:ethanolamine utilization protein EutP (predicted NTPase)